MKLLNLNVLTHFPTCLEYRSPVWSSAADSHLKFWDRAVSSVKFLLPNLSIDLWHRHKVSSYVCCIKFTIARRILCAHLCLSLLFFAHNIRKAIAANSIPIPSVRFNTTTQWCWAYNNALWCWAYNDALWCWAYNDALWCWAYNKE